MRLYRFIITRLIFLCLLKYFFSTHKKNLKKSTKYNRPLIVALDPSFPNSLDILYMLLHTVYGRQNDANANSCTLEILVHYRYIQHTDSCRVYIIYINNVLLLLLLNSVDTRIIMRRLIIHHRILYTILMRCSKSPSTSRIHYYIAAAVDSLPILFIPTRGSHNDGDDKNGFLGR